MMILFAHVFLFNIEFIVGTIVVTQLHKTYFNYKFNWIPTQKLLPLLRFICHPFALSSGLSFFILYLTNDEFVVFLNHRKNSLCTLDGFTLCSLLSVTDTHSWMKELTTSVRLISSCVACTMLSAMTRRLLL